MLFFKLGGNYMDLISSIYEYLHNNKINYAIMIDGEWGSGKTVFIKNNVIKKYDNSLYISLYGVSTIDKLSEKIYLELLKSKATFNPISNFFRKLYKNIFFKIIFFIPVLLFKLLKLIYIGFNKIIWFVTYNYINLKTNINISSLSSKDFYGILKLFKNLNKYILVFDDLERCCISMDEVLGFINDFVEHNNMKCIIIANEEEINKIQTQNLELKILTAANEKIEFYDSEDIKPGKYSKKENGKLDNNDLKKRIEYLYDDCNKYKLIKEKLIGKEFKFIPDLDDIYDKLAFKYKNHEDFYSILNDTKSVVINTMKNGNFNNIRTMDFYFDNFFHIYNASFNFINESKINHDFIYSNLSSSIINGCILIKRGYNLQLLPTEKTYDYISYEKDENSLFSSKLYLNFDFVNEYLTFNYIKTSNIEKTINDFANSNCDKLSENDPFNLLNEYWFYSSKELLIILNDIYNNILEDKYNSSLFIPIIKKISYLEVTGFNNSIIDKIVSIIVTKVEKGENVIISDHEFFNDNNAYNNYLKHISLIKQVISKNKKDKKESNLEDIFVSDNWGVEFCKYIEKNKDEYLRNKKFFAQLDVKRIIKLLKQSKIKDVYYFKYSLDNIYDFANVRDFFLDDLENIKLFKTNLKKEIKVDKIEDPMLKYPFKLLYEKLDDIIERLDK